ncbi:MAG TPA: isochorismatase family protein [Haliangium sp.]|nr:isochorismatase family protein [Haliangium sp.]
MSKARHDNALLDPEDALVLLIDHQSGLLQTVKDIGLAELRTNATALAKVATLMNIPVVTTASVPEGPNGPLISDISQHAPHAVYVPRQGEVNAWDNQEFVRAVHNTGKQTLLIAGIWTSVCVAFPAISARAEGYRVYAVIDASGDMSWMASQITMARLTQAGVIPISTNAVIADLQKTWNRPDAMEFAALYAEFAPSYRAVLESYRQALDVGSQTEN